MPEQPSRDLAVPDDATVDEAPAVAEIVEPPRRVYDLRPVTRTVVTVYRHPHTRLAGRHLGHVAAGIVVAWRRRSRGRTLTSQMAELAAARGEHEEARKWAELDHRLIKERTELRRRGFQTAGQLLALLPKIILGCLVALAAFSVLLMFHGGLNGGLNGFLAPWRFAAGVAWTVFTIARTAWSVLPYVLPPAALAWFWHLGRTATDLAPAWSVAAKEAAKDRGLIVTADGITLALLHTPVPDLRAAFRKGWKPQFHTAPVKDGEGYFSVFSLPMGVTPEMLADKVDVFARNLYRAKTEVWPADAERGGIAPAGYVSMWVANPGVLDRPAPEYPLMHEGQADVFEGIPGGVTARGDLVLIPVAANNAVAGGQMGQGKSNGCRVYLLGCATDPLCEIDAFVFAGNADFDAYAPRLNNYFKGATDATVLAATGRLEELLAEVEYRENRLAELKALKLTRKLAEAHPDLHPIVSLFSECHELFGHKEHGERAAELAIRIIKRARKTGVTLVFDTQSSRKNAIPSELVELVSVNACFYVKSWRSNDGFLGDGSFAAGIRATELRPGRDRGRSLITGVSDAQFELLKWYFIFNDPDTGHDDATPVIARCMKTLAPGTKVSGGGGAPLPVITVRDLLDDLAELMKTRPRAKLAELAVLLRDMDKAYLPYRRLDGVRLAELLDAEGVKWVYPKNVPQLDRAELAKIIGQRVS